MSSSRWLIVGTDKRLAYCSEQLKKQQIECHHIHSNNFTAEFEQQFQQFNPTHIVLPILQMQGIIPFDLFHEKMRFFAGQYSDVWKQLFEEYGFQLESYLHDEVFVQENAKITAEAFLIYFYSLTGVTIAHKRFYVAGYGRVGKEISKLLQALQADVTVIARSLAQLEDAKSKGLKTSILQKDMQWDDGYFINTIPAQWLSIEEDHNSFIFDIASSPGCLANEVTPEYYRLLPGLPGLYFPADAGRVLAQTLLAKTIE